MKVVQEVSKSINPIELKDGQLAVIEKWADQSAVGEVIQCHFNYHNPSTRELIVLGKRSGLCYSYNTKTANFKDCLVRVLEPGTILEV